MTVAQLNNKLENIIKEIRTDSSIMVAIGMDATAMIKRRVQETGKNADGQKYEGYSTRPMLIGKKSFYKTTTADAVFGSKEKRKELKWVTIGDHHLAVLPGGYKKLRELQGYRTDIVNFTISERMWQDIGIVSNNGDHSSGVVIIGAKTQENKEKLSGNTKRKGDILDLSDSEIQQLKNDYKVKMIKIFRENGL